MVVIKELVSRSCTICLTVCTIGEISKMLYLSTRIGSLIVVLQKQGHPHACALILSEYLSVPTRA